MLLCKSKADISVCINNAYYELKFMSVTLTGLKLCCFTQTTFPSYANKAIVYEILVPRLVTQVYSWLCACPLFSPAMKLKGYRHGHYCMLYITIVRTILYIASS